MSNSFWQAVSGPIWQGIWQEEHGNQLIIDGIGDTCEIYHPRNDIDEYGHGDVWYNDPEERGARIKQYNKGKAKLAVDYGMLITWFITGFITGFNTGFIAGFYTGFIAGLIRLIYGILLGLLLALIG